jgi:hypothetical protein
MKTDATKLLREEHNDAILDEFRNFLYIVWTEALGLPEPTPLQYDIAYELQYGYEPDADGLLRCQIQAARHFGKTYILAAFAVWLLLRDPNTAILFLSMNQRRASEAVSLMRQIIDSVEMCHHLRPREGQKDSENRFEVGAMSRASKDPSVAAYGIMSAAAGTHPRVIICDDAETKENSLTALKRERLWIAFMEFENMINPGGIIIHMGTPQSGDSVYNRLAKDYRLKRWPGEFPDAHDELQHDYLAPWVLNKLMDDPSLAGQPTNPEMFGREQLAQKLAVMGPYHYGLQIKLDTRLADQDKYPLKLADLIVMSIHPEYAPKSVIWGTTDPFEEYENTGFSDDRLYKPSYFEPDFMPYTKKLMYIDPAGSGGDLVGYCIIGSVNGYLFVFECGGLPGGHSEATLTKLAKLAHQYDVKQVVVESNFGDGLYEKALSPIMGRVNGPTQIVGKRAKQQQKENRIIDILGPVVSSHRMIISPKVAKNKETMYQYTHITRIKGSLPEDGAIDAWAGAVAEFVDLIGLDPEVLEQKRQEKERQDVAKQFEKEFHEASGRIWFTNAQVPKEKILNHPNHRRKRDKRWQKKRPMA